MTVMSRHCYVKVTSSSYVPSQLIHELLGSPLFYRLTVSLSLSHWYSGSGLVLDCIDY